MTWRTGDAVDLLTTSANRLLTSAGHLESLPLTDGLTGYLPPRPPTVPIDPNSLYWISEVMGQGWQPLVDSRLATVIVNAPAYSSTAARITQSGVAYLCPHYIRMGPADLEADTIRPRLRVLTLGDSVRKVAEREGWSVSPSDKGLFARRCEDLLGGADALLDLSSDLVCLELLNELRSPATASAGLRLNDGRIYFPLADVESAIASAGAGTSAIELVESGVLRRGLLFKCDLCRQTSFYEQDELADRLRCARCRQPFGISAPGWLGTDEPQWHYRVAEVLFQFLENNGDLGLRATQTFLRPRRESQLAFEYLHEIDLVDGGDPKPIELDICVQVGGDLWIGEAKTGPNLGNKRERIAKLRGLRRAAEVLRPRGLVFVTASDSWTDHTRGEIARSFESMPLEVKMISSPRRRPQS